jgi:spore cortex biosynthesis protein YabQ
MTTISENILKEANILVQSLLTGFILMFVYDLLRIIRRILPHGTVWIAVEDFLFWAGSAIAIFVMLYNENDGYLRGFAIGSIAMAMLLYNGLISRFVIKRSVFILEKMLYLIFRPLVCLFRMFKKPINAVCGSGKKVVRFYKKRLKKIVKAVKMGLSKH